jgi:hypothetical protein
MERVGSRYYSRKAGSICFVAFARVRSNYYCDLWTWHDVYLSWITGDLNLKFSARRHSRPQLSCRKNSADTYQHPQLVQECISGLEPGNKRQRWACLYNMALLPIVFNQLYDNFIVQPYCNGQSEPNTYIYVESHRQILNYNLFSLSQVAFLTRSSIPSCLCFFRSCQARNFPLYQCWSTKSWVHSLSLTLWPSLPLSL